MLGEATRVEIAVHNLDGAARAWETLLGVTGARSAGRVRFATIGLRSIDLVETRSAEGGVGIELLAGAGPAPQTYRLNGVRVSVVRESEASSAAGGAFAPRPYVIDVGVRDLDAAAAAWAALLGREGTRMHPDMDISGELAGCHFATGGVYSIGLMALRHPARRMPPPREDADKIGAWLLQRQLETRGEGISCIGFQVATGVAATLRDLSEQGVRFLHDEPQRYLVGENAYVDPASTNECVVIYATHDAEAYVRWQASLPDHRRERR